jgi:hypothetical protein
MTHQTRTTPRPQAFALCLAILGLLGFMIPASATADTETSALEFVIVSDDIQKDIKETERGAGSGSNSDSGSGEGNNGHGNNLDGVDSSNPGQGGGGPNGAVDPSGGVDDEAGGGGSISSKDKTNNGKGSSK